MYNLTQFAVQLNELEPNIAPTDSRLRADIRSMEENEWAEADEKKLFLEDKQRARLAGRSEEPGAFWFREVVDPYLKEKRYMFTDEYWVCKAKQNWTRCPYLF